MANATSMISDLNDEEDGVVTPLDEESHGGDGGGRRRAMGRVEFQGAQVRGTRKDDADGQAAEVTLDSATCLGNLDAPSFYGRHGLYNDVPNRCPSPNPPCLLA